MMPLGLSQLSLETINDEQSFASELSISFPQKMTDHESSQHLQESANETAKFMMTRSLVKAAHLLCSQHSSPSGINSQASYNTVLNVRLQILCIYAEGKERHR